MFKKDYDAIIRENFDLSDKATLKYIVSLEESDKDKVLDALANSLYDSIVSNVDQIDFGTIPMSRGDITKVENFDKTEKCLEIMRKLVLEYKQSPAIVDVVITAIQNVKDLKGPFIKAYALDVELPMLIYNLIVLSIERSVSMLITTCTTFISDPKTKTMKQALDKVSYQRSQDDVMFQQLSSFNKLCKDGTMLKLIDAAIKNNGKLKESIEYDIDSTPQDNDPDAIMPIQVTDEDDVNSDVESPFDSDNTVEPFGNDEAPSADPNPQAPVPPQEPITGEDLPMTAPSKNDYSVIAPGGYVSSDEPAEVPQIDDLPVSEPDDNREPISIFTLQSIPDVEEAPDINPNPETDPNLNNGEAPVIEQDPEEDEPPFDDGYNGYDEGVIEKIDGLTKQVWNSGIGGKATIVSAAILGTIIISSALKFALIKVLIPSLRQLAYIFMYTRFKLADYWTMQADFLEANADELENSTDMNEDKKQKITKKQRKWAETFRKWSNFFNIDKKNAENKANQQIKEDEKNKKKIATNDDGEDVLF